MKRAATIAIALIALEHLGILILEMFFWQTHYVRTVFHTSPECAAVMSVLAANQGLYNGFLAAGLVWGLAIDSGRVAVFFLSCVIIAGIFGALTVMPSIFFVQAVPAAVALVLAVLSKTSRFASRTGG